MEAKLIIVGGKANKGHVALRLPTTVGRSREADLTIAHPMVSRRHCELFEQDGLLMVRDLGSLNGTIVRKERITKAEPIRPNEEFTVGPLTFRAEYEYAGAVAGPPETPVQVAVDGDEPLPDFFGLDEPSPGQSESASVEPAVKGGVAGDEGPPDFAAWDAASDKKTPGTAASQPPTEPAPPNGPPRLPSSSPTEEAAPAIEPPPDIPEFPAADVKEQAASDFALGPVRPQGRELDNLLAGAPASSDTDDSPPAFDEAPNMEPSASEEEAASKPPAPAVGKGDKGAGSKSADRSPSKQKPAAPADSAAPASANGQKSDQPKEFSEEDLDEFFKDAL